MQTFHAGAQNELRGAKTSEDLKRVCRVAHAKFDSMFSAVSKRVGGSIACQAGCAYCCHIKVDVSPGDAFVIADYLRNKFSPAERDKVLRRAKENWKIIEPLTASQHEMTILPCPLLNDDRCSVYPVRPPLCRLHHSRNVEVCKQNYYKPALPNQVSDPIEEVKFACSGALLGVAKAFEDKDLDAKPYDINAALIQALENPHSERRWRDGKNAFPKAMLAKDFREGMAAERREF